MADLYLNFEPNQEDRNVTDTEEIVDESVQIIS
jgi:hypothetical protein